MKLALPITACIDTGRQREVPFSVFGVNVGQVERVNEYTGAAVVAMAVVSHVVS